MLDPDVTCVLAMEGGDYAIAAGLELVETFLLLAVNHQSLIATKASRIVRAAYIAGCSGTACTISDQLYGVKALADYLALSDETVDDRNDLTIFDPNNTWKRKTLTNFSARELLVPVFQSGKLVYRLPGLEEIRAYCAQQLDTLWEEVKRFENPHGYYVDLSQKLWDIRNDLLINARNSQIPEA